MNEMIMDILVSVVVALLGLAASYVTLYAKKAKAKAEAEISKIQCEQKQGLLLGALTQIDSLVEKTVGAVEQTTAKALREAVKDGTADREKLVALSQQVYAEVVLQLSDEYEQAVEGGITDVYTYIMNCIENQVLKVKSASGV